MNQQYFQDKVLKELKENRSFQKTALKKLSQQEGFNEVVLKELKENRSFQKTVLEKFSQQEGFNDFIAQQINTLQIDLSELKKDVSELKTDVSNLKGDVSNLKKDTKDLKGQGHRLEVLTENYMREQADLILEGAKMHTDVTMDKHVVALHS